MYVKFNLMPDTYLVVAIVYGAGGRGAGRPRFPVALSFLKAESE